VDDVEGGFEIGEGEVDWQATARMARMTTAHNDGNIL
jgi:hypothetical protein